MSDGPFIRTVRTPTIPGKPATKAGVGVTAIVATAIAASMFGGGGTANRPTEETSEYAFVGAVTIDIPAEIRPAGQYVKMVPRTDAESVVYVGIDGVDPVPSDLLKDSRVFLLDTRGLAAGRYRFAAVGAIGGEQGRADFAVVIGIPGPDPPPGPGPNPPPGPTPVVPDGEFGLTKFAYTEAMKVAAADRVKASAFGDNFSAVSSQLVAGGYLSIALANADLKQKNSDTLGTNREPWLPFFTVEAAQLQTLQTNGQVTDMPTLGRAYKAVADGLKLAK